MPGEHDHPDPSDRSGGTVGQVRPGQQAQGAKQPVPLIDAISPGVQTFPPLAGGPGGSFSYGGTRSNLGQNSRQQQQPQPPKMNDLQQFYMEPVDMMSWQQYNFSFKFCIEMCLDALCKSSKQLFVAHLNMISRMVVGYQVIAKMEKPELIALSSSGGDGDGDGGANHVGAPIIDDDALDNVRLILRKITSALAQFTINGYLHLSAAADSPNYLGALDRSDDGKEKAVDGSRSRTRSGLSGRKAKQQQQQPQHLYKKDVASVGGSASSSSYDDGEETDFGGDSGSDSDVDSNYSDSDSDEEVDEDDATDSKVPVDAKTTPKLVLNDGSSPIKPTTGPAPATTKKRSTFASHNKQNSIDEHELYLKQARKNATKLLNRAQDLRSQFAKMSIAKGEDPESLPLCYPRFYKNRFQGGNFKNQFIDGLDGHYNNNGGFSGGWNSSSGSGSAGGSSLGGSGYGYNFGGGAKQQSDAFMDDNSNNNSMRLLLDDSLYDSMVKLEAKAKEMLGGVLEVVQTPVPKEVKLTDFIEDRNLNILTLVYHTIPILSHIMNTVENIDFTVFIMINKLSKGARYGGPAGRSGGAFSSGVGGGAFSGGSRFTGGGMTSRQDTITDLEEDVVGSNSQFYETTAKSLELMISEFMHLKQNLHTMVTMLILDAQNLTVEDPETFNGLRDDGVVYNPQAGQTEIAKLAKAVQDSLTTQSMENDYVYDGNLKLITTIHDLELQINLLVESVSQLKEQRTNIMNYCSRLMNTDFNVASLFIAERHNTMFSSVVTAPSEYLFERKSTMEGESVPWFMDIDDEEKSLIYDSSGLKGGSVAGLVAKLVDPVMPEEPEFVDTMLTFFATFTTPMQFFTLLIDKFRLDLPEGLSYEEYNAWLEKKFKPQQTRVISVFEKLFSKYWLVHYTSDALIAKWRDFVDSSSIISQEQRNLGFMVMEIKTQQEYFECFGNGNPEPIKVPANPPDPVGDFHKLRDVMKIRVLNIAPVELARQITLIQFELQGCFEKFQEHCQFHSKL
ncbi:unnamed protein product [Ambrosiozyma monospora]|uniref:Unnamed protein product n=1 Tax=Ambrosiozyma monospora TaxID=43982 RepID=A0ACB5SXF1_AMBMO|nr:unnamed protein product [Ambrosiozyma monospora]